MPFPSGFGYGQALINHSLEEHQACHGVLYTCPYLITVQRHGAGSPTPRPSADEETAFLTLQIGPRFLYVFPEVIPEVVAVDREQGLPDMFSGEDVTQIQYMCPPLAEKLVGVATCAILHRFILLRIVSLDIVLPIPKLGLHPGPSLLKQPTALLGKIHIPLDL